MKNSQATTIFLTFFFFIQSSSGCPVVCECINTQVNCRGRSLSIIPNDIPSDTTILDLSDNAITSLGTSLSNLVNLQTLNLHDNSISSIDDVSFANLSEMIDLDLSSNVIMSLSSKAFGSFTKLTSLNLDQNLLESIPNGLFNMTYNLKRLDLSDNHLTDRCFQVINTIFLALLEELNLSGNVFNHLPYLAFNNLASLQNFLLLRCSTESIDSNSFIGLSNVRLLDLSRNQLTTLRREMFQTIPNLGQLGIVGNPISCSCSVKQVRDYLNEKTVTLLVPSTCALQNGTQWNIETDDLSSLCPDPVITPPSPVEPFCEENMTLSLKTLDIGEDYAEFKWDIDNAVIPGYAELNLYVRKTSVENEDEYNIKINEPPDTPIIVNLDVASPYVACIYLLDCRLRTCINFATIGYEDGATSGPLSLGEALGVTSACFALVIIILIVAMVVTICKRKKEDKSHYIQPVQPTETPQKVPIYLNEDPYEDIPQDAPISKIHTKRNANDALPQPNENVPAKLPGDIPLPVTASKQRPVTTGSHVLNPVGHPHTIPNKDDPHHLSPKQDPPKKQDTIAAGAQTKVFRRPNTMGSREILTDGPGLPPKSQFLSRSQEIPQSHTFSAATIVPISFDNANPRPVSNVYIEPDD